MIQFPSLQMISKQMMGTVKRFPISLLITIFGTVVSCLLSAAHKYHFSDPVFDHLSLCIRWVFLSFPLSIAIALIAERYKWKAVMGFVAQGLSLALVFVFCFFSERPFELVPEHHMIRQVLLWLAFHLLVSFAPFIRRGTVVGFWQFNRILFSRFLMATFFSAVLYLGLVIALVSIRYLLNFDADWTVYMYLFYFVSGVFHPLIFLSGVPQDLEALEEFEGYPLSFKIFCQFILLPLLILYMAILYLYEAKIILLWDWPKGWVGYLVIALSVLGVLLMLLIHPLRLFDKAKWSRFVTKGFYIAVLPLLGLLFFALYIRIHDYGVTEYRYFLATAGVWLFLLSLYFVVKKSWDIRVIPQSLFVILICISFGPLGAFQVSLRSQISRLQEVLQANSLLKDGKLVQAWGVEIPRDDYEKIRSGMKYIFHRHGDQHLNHILSDELIYAVSLKDYRSKPWTILQWIGHKSEKSVPANLSTASFELPYKVQETMSFDVAGYDVLTELNVRNRADYSKSLRLNEKDYKLVFDSKDLSLIESSGSKSLIKINVFSIAKGIHSLYNQKSYNKVPLVEMVHKFENNDVKVKLVIERIRYSYAADDSHVNQFKSHVIFKLK